jgi:hypothetical protein
MSCQALNTDGANGHVLRKAKERLGAIYGKNSQFKADFHRIVDQMLTREEFEGAWAQMLCTYTLEKNPYLKQIYETREKWAKPYFSGIFCARMTSTQRSKSANHMLRRTSHQVGYACFYETIQQAVVR